MIIVIKHIDIEGPGTIGSFFEQKGFEQTIIELAKEKPLPGEFYGIEGVIVLGGPMNVYEESLHPFLAQENKFIQEVLNRGIPLLGICLGSQLIAKACGAKVTKAEVKEIGWSEVHLTDQGIQDPLMKGLEKQFEVFQWHEDTFTMPQASQLLATSKSCLHQAMKIGQQAYGLQFHIEVTEEMIKNWIERYFKVSDAYSHPQGKEMLDHYQACQNEFNKQAEVIYQNFADLIKEHSLTKI